MRNVFRYSVLLAFFGAVSALAPAHAQGTAAQRAACQDDAYRFCDAQIPDAIAVEDCLRARVNALSPACQREFGVTGGKKKRGRR